MRKQTSPKQTPQFSDDPDLDAALQRAPSVADFVDDRPRDVQDAEYIVFMHARTHELERRLEEQALTVELARHYFANRQEHTIEPRQPPQNPLVREPRPGAKLFTRGETAYVLNCSLSTVDRLRRNRELVPKQRGHFWHEDVEALAKQGVHDDD